VTGLVAAVIGLLGMLAWEGAPVLAQEATSIGEPIPSSAQEIVTPMARAFEEERARERLSPWLKDYLKDTSPFFRDTRIDFNLRSYYFYQYNNSDNINEAWTIGGALSYKSGWFLDHFGVGSVFYISEPLYAPAAYDGTGLLEPDQEGYTTLGQVYGRVKLLEENFINLYRYEYETPFINGDDSRMTPNTFEGYTFLGAYGDKDGGLRFSYGGGYIEKMKPRNADTFTSMSEIAGAKVSRGVYAAGGTLSYGGFRIGGVNYYSQDIINIVYAETSYHLSGTDDLGALFSAQYATQQSTGNNLLTGSAFAVTQVGAKADVSYKNAILTLAYTNVTNTTGMRHPWSSYPGFTAAMVEFFEGQGQGAFMIKGSYDFSRLGLEGFAAYALWTHGWGPTNSANPKVHTDEYDFDLQWRPGSGLLRGIWFRVRYGIASYHDTGTGPNVQNARLIANYDFSLF
jgi:hypothetical protein